MFQEFSTSNIQCSLSAQTCLLCEEPGTHSFTAELCAASGLLIEPSTDSTRHNRLNGSPPRIKSRSLSIRGRRQMHTASKELLQKRVKLILTVVQCDCIHLVSRNETVKHVLVGNFDKHFAEEQLSKRRWQVILLQTKTHVLAQLFPLASRAFVPTRSLRSFFGSGNLLHTRHGWSCTSHSHKHTCSCPLNGCRYTPDLQVNVCCSRKTCD